VDVIHPRRDEPGFASADQLYIYPNDCIDCSACVPVCPVSAIFLAEDLPEKWADAAQKNADWFANKEGSVPPG
jgi:ferredoxin